LALHASGMPTSIRVRTTTSQATAPATPARIAFRKATRRITAIDYREPRLNLTSPLASSTR
jgi:hypothetical protein